MPCTVVGLIGKRCIVKGEINGQMVKVLWDTGAQVSIISDGFVRRNFPDIAVKDISELLDIELNVTAANGSKVPYIGWVELNFKLWSSKDELAVPFLATEQSLDSPLIGFNVIEKIIKTVSENHVLHQLITSSCTGLDSQTASKLVSFIQSLNKTELCSIKTMNHSITIPPRQSQKVTCRANRRPIEGLTPVLFEQDEACPWPSGLEVQETVLTMKRGKSCQVGIDIVNNTDHDIVLRGRTSLGRLKRVQSVTPVEVTLKDSEGTYEASQERRSENTPGESALNEPQASTKAGKPISIPPHIKDIDVEGLKPD